MCKFRIGRKFSIITANVKLRNISILGDRTLFVSSFVFLIQLLIYILFLFESNTNMTFIFNLYTVFTWGKKGVHWKDTSLWSRLPST